MELSIFVFISVLANMKLSTSPDRTFVNDVRQVCGFLQVLHHDITEILLKVALNTINQTKPTKVCT
jgi:hypothetical protein